MEKLKDIAKHSFATELRARLSELRRLKAEVLMEIAVLEMHDPAQADIARGSLERMFDEANRTAPDWWLE